VQQGVHAVKILRLLLFSACNRACEGCCNKQWDLDALPVCDDYHDYDMVLLTGGEPMLNPTLVAMTANRIRCQTMAPIILYTAKPERLPGVMPFLDGVTVTLHEQADVDPFLNVAHKLHGQGWSLRVNVFAGVEIGDVPGWEMKRDIEWIEDCPMPEGEVFMRLSDQPALRGVDF
jgi:hypothetical protein